MIIVEVFWSSVLTPFVQGICGFVIGTKNKKCEINKWPTSFLEQAEIYLKDTFPTCHSHLAHQVYIFFLIFLCYQDVSSIGFEVTNFTNSKLLNLEHSRHQSYISGLAWAATNTEVQEHTLTPCHVLDREMRYIHSCHFSLFISFELFCIGKS